MSDEVRRRVLITGGAGFLGRGILRRVGRGLPWDVTIYSRDEAKQVECRERYPNVRYVLGDVRDFGRLLTVVDGHDLIIHAAAMKYIPEAEFNAGECVSVNIFGATNVIEAAKEVGVDQVIGISTDKAVQPVNIYGATKMVMERMFADQEVQKIPEGRPRTQFKCVRYGNVIGSTGSVIPLFERQMRENGKVTLTDPRMTRFWMGIDEAIDVILVAIDRAGPGSIVVPSARAMTMKDVATTIAGAAIEEIGVRPGEKSDEMLIHYAESLRTRRLGDHYELLPVTADVGKDAFTLASHTPNHWMTPEELRPLIEDAKTV